MSTPLLHRPMPRAMLTLESQLETANHGSPYCGDSVQ